MIGTLRTVVLDSPTPRHLAAFYTALTGWTQTYADEEWITLETGDGWRVATQLSPDHLPPSWPDPAHPNRRIWTSVSQTLTKPPTRRPN